MTAETLAGPSPGRNSQRSAQYRAIAGCPTRCRSLRRIRLRGRGVLCHRAAEWLAHAGPVHRAIRLSHSEILPAGRATGIDPGGAICLRHPWAVCLRLQVGALRFVGLEWKSSIKRLPAAGWQWGGA